MAIRAYGLFWRADEVDWTPGRGRRGTGRMGFRLLGRLGKRRPGLQVADFRDQSGLYILYGDYGPHYVGLAREARLGQRLKDHRTDLHARKWDRFSWFGFRAVLRDQDEEGLRRLKNLAGRLPGIEPSGAIREMEALLIHAMGLSNLNHTRFPRASAWDQIPLHEAAEYLSRVRP